MGGGVRVDGGTWAWITLESVSWESSGGLLHFSVGVRRRNAAGWDEVRVSRERAESWQGIGVGSCENQLMTM